MLSSDQRHAFERLSQLAQTPTRNIIFLDAPGGTGKTFLLNLLAHIRAHRQIAIAVASSGIAAIYITNGCYI